MKIHEYQKIKHQAQKFYGADTRESMHYHVQKDIGKFIPITKWCMIIFALALIPVACFSVIFLLIGLAMLWGIFTFYKKEHRNFEALKKYIDEDPEFDRNPAS